MHSGHPEGACPSGRVALGLLGAAADKGVTALKTAELPSKVSCTFPESAVSQLASGQKPLQVLFQKSDLRASPQT